MRLKTIIACPIIVAALFACRHEAPTRRPEAVAPVSVTTPAPEPAPRQPVKPSTEPLRVGGDVIPPVAIHRVSPDYTAAARRIRVRGTPIFEATITAAGDIENVRVLRSAHPEVDKAIVAALEQWKFRPATRNGKPVAVYYTLTVNIHPQ